MLCTCLWRDMKTNSRLRLLLRRRWANAERRVLVASTDGFKPYSRLTACLGVQPNSRWWLHRALPISRTGNGSRGHQTKYGAQSMWMVGVDIHISILMEARGRAGTRNGADKECSKATDTVVSMAARTISSRCFVHAAAAAASSGDWACS